MLLRYTSAVLLGTVATFGLLTLMRSVIADPLPAEDSGIKGDIVDWARLVEEKEVIERRPPEPPRPPDEPPPKPPREKIIFDGPTIGDEWKRLEPTSGGGEGTLKSYVFDGEYLPIVRVAPIYPRRALTRGIEGYVLVEFVVTETGSVRNPVVLVSDPPGFFERAAVSAVLKYKYKPKVEDGKSVAVSGVRTRIVFELED